MYQLTKKYPQKRAFITGAGSGLGRELCKELAADKWTIGICDISEKGLTETAELITNAGGKAIPYLMDVADKTAYQTVAENFLEKTGGIDLLVNNAGVGDGSPFEEYGLDNWEWITGINQMGVIYGCHYFIPTMKTQQSGHIINISSIAAVATAPNMSPYNTTKAAVKALSETLYAELKEHGISVSVAMPFFFRTNVLQHARGQHADSKEMGKYMVHGAKQSADAMAKRLLKKAGAGKFHILFPAQAILFFHLKRLFPMSFLKLNAFMSTRKEKLREMAKKQYDKQIQKQNK
jgi:NAD(P)-dependent dehydrogenase (short-subunit alcohol dehydrogenase family)